MSYCVRKWAQLKLTIALKILYTKTGENYD